MPTGQGTWSSSPLAWRLLLQHGLGFQSVRILACQGFQALLFFSLGFYGFGALPAKRMRKFTRSPFTMTGVCDCSSCPWDVTFWVETENGGFARLPSMLRTFFTVVMVAVVASIERL